MSRKNDCDLGSNGMPSTPCELELLHDGHEGLVLHFLESTAVGRALVRMVGIDEAAQQCRVGIAHAARTFDRLRGTQFSTHAWFRLQHAAQAVMRHRMAHPTLASLDEERFDTTLGAELEDRRGGDRWSPVVDAVRDWTRANGRKGAICAACWFDGLNHGEAGRLFGVSRERVRQVIYWGRAEVARLLRREVA